METTGIVPLSPKPQAEELQALELRNHTFHSTACFPFGSAVFMGLGFSV